MHRDDPETVDRLDQALDALAGGGSRLVEPWLDATDLRLRTLDTAFAPNEGVLMSIWDGLTESATAPAMNGVALNGSVAEKPAHDWRVIFRWLGQRGGFAGGAAIGEGGHIGPPLHDGGTAERVGWWRRRWSVAEVSSVALVLLVLVAGYAAIQLAGIGDSDNGEGGPAGIAVATPSPNELIVPPPSECTVAPRPTSFFEQFVATPTGAGNHAFAVDAGSIDPEDLAAIEVDTRDGGVTLYGGNDADAATVSAVAATISEFLACINAGDGARTNALLTDDFLRRVIDDGRGLSPDALAASAASPTPKDPDDWDGHFPVQQVRMLDNGHVAAILPVPSDDPGEESEIDYVLLIFANTGDRWLIDSFQNAEARELLEQPSIFPNAATQEVDSITSVPTPSAVVDLQPTTGAQVISPPTMIIALEPTPTSSPTQAPPSIESQPIDISVTVDGAGLLALEPDAIEEAIAALREALAVLPAGCRVGFALTSGYANNISEGNRLAEAINTLLREEFPDRFSTTAFETIALIDQPYGKVDLRMYVFSGCGDEVVEIVPTPTGTFMPTHRISTPNQVNLRAGPSIETEVVVVLRVAEYLQYLDEDAPTDDPARDGSRWVKVRTEDGQIGWVREIDVEPIDAPTPTPVG